MALCFLSMIPSLLLPFKSWLVYQKKMIKEYLFSSWAVISCLQCIELHTYSTSLILLFVSVDHGECKTSHKFCKVLMQKMTWIMLVFMNALTDQILSLWATKQAWCIKMISVSWSLSRSSFKIAKHLKQ